MQNKTTNAVPATYTPALRTAASEADALASCEACAMGFDSLKFTSCREAAKRNRENRNANRSQGDSFNLKDVQKLDRRSRAKCHPRRSNASITIPTLCGSNPWTSQVPSCDPNPAGWDIRIR